MTWQPMETAPKDGTRILARIGDEPTVVYWDAAESQFVGGPKTGAWVLTVSDTHAFNNVEHPEAWAPLP